MKSAVTVMIHIPTTTLQILYVPYCTPACTSPSNINMEKLKSKGAKIPSASEYIKHKCLRHYIVLESAAVSSRHTSKPYLYARAWIPNHLDQLAPAS